MSILPCIVTKTSPLQTQQATKNVDLQSTAFPPNPAFPKQQQQKI